MPARAPKTWPTTSPRVPRSWTRRRNSYPPTCRPASPVPRPRSEGTVTIVAGGRREATHGTFNTAARRLPAVAAMGFDVVYLPPIHPIGRINRKGRNNTLLATEDDVGSPWAIGATEGGHD